MEKPTEYAALDFDGTERRANYRTVAYRIDILHLCERKDAAAILYEIIYRWQTEVRKPEITKEIERRKKANLPPLTEDEVDNQMWVWMSYNDFVRESGGAVGYNTVIRMLDYLVEDVKIVECRENHDPRYPDYEYRVRLDIVKEKLKALPATPAFLPKVPKKKSNKGGDSTQIGTAEKRSTQKGRRAQRSTQVGTDSTQMGTATTQEGRGVYPDGGTSHTTTHTSHIEHTEGTYRASGSQGQECADAQPAPAFSSDEPYVPDLDYTSQEQEMIAPNITVGSTIIHKDDTTARRTGVVKEMQGDQLLILWRRTHVAHWAGANGLILLSDWQQAHPAADTKPDGNKRSENKTTSQGKTEEVQTPPAPPECPPADAPWNTTTCLALFTYWRGAPLIRKHECMEASHCAKGLATNYTRKQVEMARRWMCERDPYWSQKASAVDVCTVAGHIHQMLADIKTARAAKQKEANATPEMTTIELLRAQQAQYGGLQA